jgi:hypothetical protein
MNKLIKLKKKLKKKDHKKYYCYLQIDDLLVDQLKINKFCYYFYYYFIEI